MTGKQTSNRSILTMHGGPSHRSTGRWCLVATIRLVARCGAFLLAFAVLSTQQAVAQAPSPVVTSVSPDSGTAGTSVTITGTGLHFDSCAFAVADVRFGDVAVRVSASATTLTATAPPHAPGTVEVTVENCNGEVSATSPAARFTYLAPLPPVVTSVSPSSGTAGTSVTITGTGLHFDSCAFAVADVRFGDVAVRVPASATTLTATAPPHAPGTVEVTVENCKGEVSATNPAARFTYLGAPPSVTLTTPPNGATYLGGQMVAASYSCQAGAGSTLASSGGCVGTVPNGSPIDTSAAGAYTFRVTATDTAGQTTTVTNAYTVIKDPTVLVANPLLVQISGLKIYLKSSATLRRTSPSGPLAGKLIRFYAGTTLICQDTTDSTGLAHCSGALPLLQTLLSLGYTAKFAGDSAYTPAQATGPLLT